MAKGSPVTGDRFTERCPIGVMGRIYGTLGSLPYFAAKTASVGGELSKNPYIPIQARRRGRR